MSLAKAYERKLFLEKTVEPRCTSFSSHSSGLEATLVSTTPARPIATMIKRLNRADMVE